jgi:polyisoprenoid-binding protein YceI
MAEALAVRKWNGVDAPAPGDWALDINHTQLQFVARHMVVTKVRGRFNTFGGTIHIGEGLDDSWAELQIEVGSLDTGVTDRDNHLRSGDFFEIAKYPYMLFRTTRIAYAGENRLTVTGDLTIKDVTRPVTLDVEYEGATPNQLGGGTRIFFTGSTELDREDWGMTWNVALEAGGWLVSRKVQLEIEVAAVLKPEEAEKGDEAEAAVQATSGKAS